MYRIEPSSMYNSLEIPVIRRVRAAVGYRLLIIQVIAA